MAGAVEFVISIKDRATGGISKIASEFSTAKRNADTLTGSISSLRDKGETLRIARDSSTSIAEIRKLNKEISKTETQIDKLSSKGKGVGGALKDAFSSLPGGAFLTNPLVAATAGIGAIAKIGIENEKTRVSFEVLLGSQAKAAAMLKEMNKYAAATPYEKGDLQQAGKVMLGFGIAQDKVMPNLKMLGDVAMGDAQKLQSLTLAFSQISSAGKMQGQDLLQLINAGFNPLNEISKMTGKSMAELKKDMEKGKISADMVTGAFEHATSKGGLFYKMTDKMGQTIGGRLSTLIDTFKDRMLQLFDIVGPVLSPALDILGGILDWLKTPISILISFLQGFIGYLKEGNPIVWGLVAAITAYSIISNTAAIAGFAASVATKVWTGAQWLLNTAMDANPIGLIVAAIAILVGLVWAAVNAYDKWGAALLFLMGPIGMIVNAIMALRNNWESIVQAFKGEGIIGGLKRIGIVLLDTFLYPVQQLLGMLSKIPGLGSLAGKGEKLLSDLRKNLNLVTPESKEKKEKANGLSKQLVPGLDEKGGKGNKDDNKKTTSAVASGGARNTQITINLGKMVENIVFNGGVSENSNELTRQIEEALLRVLYAAQSAG